MHHVLKEKGEEIFVIFFDNDHVGAAVKVLADWAGNPLLDFDWYDAAGGAAKIWELHRDEHT